MEENIRTSLTAPWDTNKHVETSLKQGIILNETEVEHALDELVVSDLLKKFPRVEKFYADPLYNNQLLCLHSFVPSKGATPDEKGCYGFMKCRGTFMNEKEANDRAEFIIRNVDSFHSIYHSYCGRPFPVTLSQQYVKECSEVDIKKDIVDSFSTDIKKKKLDEEKIMKEISEKEKILLNDVKEDTPKDPLDSYIELRVKKAQLYWTYKENQKKLEHVKDIVLKTSEQISELDKSNPEFKASYFERYKSAREQAGLVNDDKTYNESFVRFMADDTEL